MKNFYELSDTKKLEVVLHIEYDIETTNDNIIHTVTLNDKKLYNKNLENSISSLVLRDSIDVRDRFRIDIGLSNINYNEDHISVFVNEITVDGKSLIPDYVHLIDYQNDKNMTNPTKQLDFNGNYVLDTVEPFYWWFHEVSGNGWLIKP